MNKQDKQKKRDLSEYDDTEEVYRPGMTPLKYKNALIKHFKNKSLELKRR